MAWPLERVNREFCQESDRPRRRRSYVAESAGDGRTWRAALTPAVFELLLLVFLVSAGCRGTRSGSDEQAGASPDASADASAAAAGSLASMSTRDVRLLYPGPDDDLLHVETRSVVAIASPEDRATQCLEELFRGPSPGLLAAVPEGTRVLQVYILQDGTAFVDLSSEVLKMKGGSTTELRTVYAIVDTLALNVEGINQVGILVEGEPRETLGGHVCTQSPLAPDFSYAEESARAVGAAAAAVGGDASNGAAGGAVGGGADKGAVGGAPGGDASNGAAGDATTSPSREPGAPDGDGTDGKGEEGDATEKDGTDGDGSSQDVRRQRETEVRTPAPNAWIGPCESDALCAGIGDSTVLNKALGDRSRRA